MHTNLDIGFIPGALIMSEFQTVPPKTPCPVLWIEGIYPYPIQTGPMCLCLSSSKEAEHPNKKDNIRKSIDEARRD
jgi:hypothetical protein